MTSVSAGPEGAGVVTDLSVVIPTFNRRELLAEAIDSVLGLRAIGVAVDIIVVDDCSTDGSWAWLQALKHDDFRILRTSRNSGQCRSRNMGLSSARGRFVLFLDSDDVLEPPAILEGLQASDALGADIAVFGWGVIRGDSSESPREEYPAPEPRFASILDDLIHGYGPVTSAGLYRAEYVNGLHWDESLRKLDDWDWFCQAAFRGGKIVTIPRRAYWMREHSGARVSNRATMLLNAHEHHAILRKMEFHIRAAQELTESRCKRLAQYYYKELRVLSLHDRPAFEAALVHIHELDPAFKPRDEERQWWMRWAARVLGTRRAVLAHSALKRVFGLTRAGAK